MRLSLFVFFIALLSCVTSLANGFAFDDHILILDNPGIFSIEASLELFTHALFQEICIDQLLCSHMHLTMH